MLGAFLLNGDSLIRFCTGLGWNPEDMLRYKKGFFIFSFPGGNDWIKMLRVPPAVVGHLEAASGLIRSVDQLDAIPPYDEILDHLTRALSLV
jgi:hypothetical protein